MAGRPPITDAQRAMLEAIGARLRSARVNAGKTQEQVGAAIGSDAAYVLSVEKGRVNVSAARLVELAVLLDITGSDLLDAAIDAHRTDAAN